VLILGVDTSGRDGSVALARGDSGSFEVIEVVALTGGSYSSEFVPAVAGMLERHGLKKSALEGFAVASGPGSFTGLRVGLSAVKGLAEVLGGRIASVSALEALAEASHSDGNAIAAMDAARKEVFAGEYEVVGGRAKCVREALMTQLDFAQYLENNPGAQLITPDADIAELARFHLKVTQTDRPRADEYARIGLLKILAGETVTVEELDANYIRRSDAEIFSKPSF
jgi:tRNA threonylcarbamoyladenosine biosynthesis protein TsaB